MLAEERIRGLLWDELIEFLGLLKPQTRQSLGEAPPAAQSLVVSPPAGAAARVMVCFNIMTSPRTLDSRIMHVQGLPVLRKLQLM